jgi:hypothetical protein
VLPQSQSFAFSRVGGLAQYILLLSHEVISQNEYPDSICSGRVNQYVPFGQKRMAF